MFKKLKERIADCESRLNTQRKTITEHSARLNTQSRKLTEYSVRLNNLYTSLYEVSCNLTDCGCRKVDTTKSNADILLDCLCDVKEKTEGAPVHIWINGVKTDRSIFKDTNDIFSVYVDLRKSFGCNSLRILEYTVDKDSVYFEIEPVTGDEHD